MSVPGVLGMIGVRVELRLMIPGSAEEVREIMCEVLGELDLHGIFGHVDYYLD